MWSFEAVATPLKEVATAQDVVVIPVFDTHEAVVLRRVLGRGLGDTIGRALTASQFAAKTVGSTYVYHAPAGLNAAAVVVVSLGAAQKVSAVDARQAGAAVAAALGNCAQTTLRLVAANPRGSLLRDADIINVAGGLVQRAYRFDTLRTTLKETDKNHIQHLVIHSPTAPAVADLWHTQELPTLHGLNRMRDLANTPANLLYPQTFAEQCVTLRELGVKVTVLEEKELHKHGMGALLGVAQGSVKPPRVVVMEWHGHSDKNQAPLALVGKGVCFDTGGISIKPAGDMENMIFDMSGAAAVTGTLETLARRKAKANVVGLIGLVENMPDGNAQRPGDVVTSASGQTIEVINTDAEGRLVLCDVLHYAQKHYKPHSIVDLATLTGAIVVALGHEYAGLFSNNDALSAQLLNAGTVSGDKLWRFPLGEVFNKKLKSRMADMMNVSAGRDAGSITAACFLQRFIENDTPWAHLDIAGTAYGKTAEGVRTAGSSGFGVRLLDQFVRSHHEG